MAAPGFSVSDLISVSNLAFRLYRRFSEAPKEFTALTNEVANLRNLVDNIRMTVRENELTVDQRNHLCNIGQGCLDSLIDLETIVRKHKSLGAKAKRSLERFTFDPVKVTEIRGKLTFHIGLLNSFNISLTTSSTARIESLLRDFISDVKYGRHEGSILSAETMPSIQRGDDDVWKELWKELKKELESAGVTPDQIAEKKEFITNFVSKAVENNLEVDQGSMISKSAFYTATDGGSSLPWTGPSFGPGTNLPPEYEFPGSEFRWTRELVGSFRELIDDAPSEYLQLQETLSTLWEVCSDIMPNNIDLMSLSFHEKLCRKPQMLTVLERMSEVLKPIRELTMQLKVSQPDEDFPYAWSIESSEMEKLEVFRLRLHTSTKDLESIFDNLGAIVLANIEDRIKLILEEIQQKARSPAILSAFVDLKSELVDNQSIFERDVQDHEPAIQSFLQIVRKSQDEVEDDELNRFRGASVVGDSISVAGRQILDDKSLKNDSSGKNTAFNMGNSRSSQAESDEFSPAQSSLGNVERKVQPKRTSVLFVDWNNTVRSPVAQVYLQYLMSKHPTLASLFSKVSSAGVIAVKPGIAIEAGLEFMLRDEGICENCPHISRRLNTKDVEHFEYTLVMSTNMKEEILSRWKTRADLSPEEASRPEVVTREDLEKRVVELGSFGGHGVREVNRRDTIGGQAWFHVGTKRIYPGYESFFGDIKAFIADFILETTGYDVNNSIAESSEGFIDSREISYDVSEDESYAEVLSKNGWVTDESTNFDALNRVISNFHASAADPLTSPASDDFGSQIELTVVDGHQQYEESDEAFKHKHHERFDRLINLLLTDVGDDNPSSVRQMILDWENDHNRPVLPVQSTHARWVLEKISTDSADACKICQTSGTKCGFVRDSKFEVISTSEADTIAKYLDIAIKQSKQIGSPSSAQQEQFRSLRDTPPVGPAAPPSIRDDVSVSVFNEKPYLTHEISKIRERDALKKSAQTNAQRLRAFDELVRSTPKQDPSPSEALHPRPLRRTRTDDMNLTKNPWPTEHRSSRTSNASDVTVTQARAIIDQAATAPTADSSRMYPGTKTPKTPGRQKKKSLDAFVPVSVLFLSSSHFYTAIMAEVYLFSQVSKSLRLACRINDVVSAGVTERPPEKSFNPKKLERLFKAHKILEFWPKKPQRLMGPYDVVEFQHILVVDEVVDLDSPYECWAEDNPDEAEDMQETDGENWKKLNFKAKIERLRDYDPDESMREMPILQPDANPWEDSASLSRKTKYGVPPAMFEKRFERVKACIDSWLKRCVGFDVVTSKFVEDEVRESVQSTKRKEMVAMRPKGVGNLAAFG